MGQMKEIAIRMKELADQCPDEFDYLEGLSESEFKEHPLAKQLAEALEVDIEFLTANFPHDVE